MADKSSSKPGKSGRLIKPAPSLRQPSQSDDAQTKRHASSKALHGLGSVLRPIGRTIARLFSPFSFLLWPFKTRPVRFIGRILATVLLINFFRGAFRELRGVEWPDRKQTTQLTFAVFVFAIIFGIIVSITDFGLDKLFKRILLK